MVGVRNLAKDLAFFFAAAERLEHYVRASGVCDSCASATTREVFAAAIAYDARVAEISREEFLDRMRKAYDAVSGIPVMPEGWKSP